MPDPKTSNETHADSDGRKEYQKPTVTQIMLVPEEAVLAVCKDGAMGTCDPDPNCLSTPRS